jgi:ketosteroid isomerase-like protein
MIIDDPATKAEVEAKFHAYEAALMANDVAALDAFFWPTTFALRFGAGESLFGYEAISAFRLSRTGGSPQRHLRSTAITCFGTDFAVAATEFQRENEPRMGRQTQVWVKFPDYGWRIASAHISFAAEKS